MSYDGLRGGVITPVATGELPLRCGPFLSSAYAEVSGIAANIQTGLKLSKNSGTFAARSSATAVTYDADGYYIVPLNATDTNTVGSLHIMFPGAPGGYRPFTMELQVLPVESANALISNVVPTEAAGPATTLIGRLNQLWGRFFRRSVLTSSSLTVYMANDTTAWTTQIISDDGTTQNMNSAS